MLEIMKKLVVAWDPDFTKLTLTERILRYPYQPTNMES